jgi:hypothetical protein
MLATNLNNLDVGNLRIRVSLTDRKPMALHRILSIVFVRTNFEMIGSHAGPMIAFVSNYQTFWHWSVMQFIRVYVCRLVVTFFAKTNLPVIAISTIPEPTTITLNNVTPEAGFNRKRLTRIVARITAVFTTPIPYAGRLFEEFLAAVSARATNTATQCGYKAGSAAEFAASLIYLRLLENGFLAAILAKDLNSGSMKDRHESKPLFSICVQRLTGVNALVGLAAL